MPTNTTALKYDYTHHMYVLDVEYLKNTWQIDFITKEGSETKAKNKLLRISMRIYNYIYNHKQRNKEYWEYYLAFQDDAIPTIRRALEQQALFDYESNAMDLQKLLGINPLNGRTISLVDIRGDRGIAIEAINALRNYKDGLLIYSGKEMYLPQTTEFDYDTMEY